MQNRIPLEEKGFMVIRQLIPLALVETALVRIKHTLTELAQALSVPIADYMYCTGRWDTASPVTTAAADCLHQPIVDYLSQWTGRSMVAKKANIICKTAVLVDPIPFHQDIAYSFQEPYHFSIWLSLNNVNEKAAALQVIPGSHCWPIAPLVDFWQPNYVDKYARWYRDQIQTITMEKGDAIVFDARLWHGSGRNEAATDRFSYVTRWVIQQQDFPFIPHPISVNFGMYNCGIVTETILSSYLLRACPNRSKLTRTALIQAWLERIDSIAIEAAVDRAQAKQALYHLLILNQATDLHGAGDIAGKVYKTLWFTLLQWLEKSNTTHA
ncbi:MAG: phytanoyl-CoA dioxygenase family protein [Candidatus Cardinium sp.]|nr:phytanoyl-CoA dioxygenase family protein [Candidatus Cardinium sp.]